MKYQILSLLFFFTGFVYSQKLELHYDLRHSTDPKHNAKNFPTLYFEYFKTQDSGHAFIKPGSFLFKMQADLLGEKNNIGKFYMQVSQTFRFWTPKIYLHLSYSGGLGVTEPKQYSFYITNTYSAGVAYPLQWKGTWLSTVLDYKYISYEKPSYDLLYTLYWWKGFLNYKMEFAGDFSIWTENKNHGDPDTMNISGKRFSFFAEPQIWLNLNKSFSMGSKINLYYRVLTNENLFQVYPTAAIKCKL